MDIKVASYLSKKHDVRVITINLSKKYDLNNLNFDYIVINYKKIQITLLYKRNKKLSKRY